MKQTKKSLKCLRPPHLLPLFQYSRDKLIQSELSLNNPKFKHLVIPNPNYFINVKERKESSSSNHTDNEDSNNEDFYLGSLKVDKIRRFKRKLKHEYLSQEVTFSSEEFKCVENDESNQQEETKKSRNLLKGKQTKRKSVSLWCLQRANENYKPVETTDRGKQQVIKISKNLDVADAMDNLFVSKSKKAERNSRRGCRAMVHEDADDINSNESKLNKKVLKSEIPQFLTNSIEIMNHRSIDKPHLRRYNCSETALLAIDSRKCPSTFETYGKTLSKKLFMNLKLSLFGQGARTEKVELVGRRPIVFGGTFPIDMPLGGDTRNRIVIEKDVTDKILPMSEVRTYEIDAPVNDENSKPEIVSSCNCQSDFKMNFCALDKPYLYRRIVNLNNSSLSFTP